MPVCIPELHSALVKSQLYHIGIDFVEPIYSTSSLGSHYTLTISDYFGKWVEAVPLPSKDASGTANI